MGISSYLSNFALGITPQGVLSALYGGTGTTTGAGATSSSPTVTAISYTGDDTATNPAGGNTVTLTGTNFAVGVTVLIGTTQATQVTRVSATQLTFIAPANAAGSYILYVINPDGSSAISVPGLQYSGVPTWTTSAGNIGIPSASTSFSTTIAATGDAPISYAIVSGALPAGISLNSSTGVISGTTPSVSSTTTYNFTIRATDAQNQDTDRAFSLNVVVAVQGQALYTIANNHNWICPAGVTSVCVVIVSGGGAGGNTDVVNGTGAGGGGGLLWANDIQVTPGQSYHLKVGGGGYYAGGDGEGSTAFSTFQVTGGKGGYGGQVGGYGGIPSVYGGAVAYGLQGGGTGGRGGTFIGSGVGGGGAGGYTGNGGNGAPQGGVATQGVGGGGGGGIGGNGTGAGFGGGGVGLFGNPQNGGAGSGSNGAPGGGGSGGSNGGSGPGGLYGGGAGYGGGNGGDGAVRIIWGPNRAFPSTNTADV
jgi:hypothetical protein